MTKRFLSWLYAQGGRRAGLLLTAVIAGALPMFDPAAEMMLRNAQFDRLQKAFPRERAGDPVVVVDIDERSLAELGQWPWPRSMMARLIDRIEAQKPVAIGIDIVFSAADRYSPRQLLAAGVLPPGMASPDMPDFDQQLAEAIARKPVTLGVGALDARTDAPPSAGIRSAVLQTGGDAVDFVPAYATALRSIPVIDRAARGHGAINEARERDGIVRRMPALLAIDGELLPGFAIEILRLVQNEPLLRVDLDRVGVRAVRVGDLRIGTDPDGAWWLHFSDPELRPRWSAADLLRGELSPSLMTGRVVLLGVSAAALGDRIVTPLGMMAGVEAHAEALENVLDLRLLTRPRAAPWLEAALFSALAVLLVLAVPSLRPARSLLLFAAGAVFAAASATLAFVHGSWLIDVANPMLGVSGVFAFMLLLSLSAAQTQRQSLRSALQTTRDENARFEGELDAARRIQAGMLPRAAQLVGGDPRLALAAWMQPARTVGGDLYDFFRIDDARLFFLVGDVAGKGLPAALFMALSKALIRSAALRGSADPGTCLSDAAAVMARENPEAMFVSIVAGLLDLDSGELAWSVAGHETPYRLADGAPIPLESAGGPALCVVEDFRYPTERLRLKTGDALCLFTDGLTDARNPRGELYGAARLRTRLQGATGEGEALLDHLRQDVLRFAQGQELADDLTILILSWRGPVAVAGVLA